MKHFTDFYRCFLLAFALLLVSGFGYAQSDKMVWGLLKGSSSQGETTWLATFPLNNPASYEKKWGFTTNYVNSGCLVDGIYYYFETVQQVYGYDCVGFFALDTQTGKSILLKDYSLNPRSTGAVCSPAYDYTTNTMYALNSLQGGTALVKVDIETGVIEKAAELTGIDNAMYSGSWYDDYLKNIAVNIDGEMYGVSYWGYLYAVNQNTGRCRKIGQLDCISAPSGAMQYLIGDLCFDNDTNTMYLWRWDFYEPNNLYVVNPTNATTTLVASLSRDHHLGEMCIPFMMAADDAPDEVSDLTFTPGPNGADYVTIEWDNPTSTYGGDRLSAIDSVVIYRDGVALKKWTDVEPGDHIVFKDENLESAYYSYRVNAYNADGKGKGSVCKGFVGHDIPVAPTNVKAVAVGGYAEITWTAPEKGTMDGWFDAENMTYAVMRYPDNKLVAESIKDTKFVDETIETMGRWQYAVLAMTPDGASAVAATDYLVAGPAFEVPHTFVFRSSEDCYIWENINADGGYGYWGYNNWPPTQTGVINKYAYDDKAPEDWLISPRIAMKKGQHYKVTFDATPGKESIPEMVEITFGQGTTVESQKKVGELIIQSNGTKNVRMNLPVPAEDGEYNFGIVHVTPMANYSLLLQNIAIEEDHEGYVDGYLTNAAGEAVAGATVIAGGGRWQAKTDAKGYYKLEYLTAGPQTIHAIALGYEQAYSECMVEELETTTINFKLVSLPQNVVKGKVIDRAGDPVSDAHVYLMGYDSHDVYTAADGTFKFDGVFSNNNYTLGVQKNRMKGYSQKLEIYGDLNVDDIVLSEDIRPASRQSVEADDKEAVVSWQKPLNDAQNFANDNGHVESHVYIQGGDNNTVFGQIYRKPALLQKISWYLLDNGSTHYSVYVYVFPLDENGVPTTEPVYKNTYAPNTDGQWSTFNLPNPIDMPNGFMVGISYWDAGAIALARDNGPNVKNTSCYKKNYSDPSEVWHFLEQNKIDGNFLIRAYGVPYNDEDVVNAPKFIAQTEETVELESDEMLGETKLEETLEAGAPAIPARAIDDHITYNVYRMKTKEVGNNGVYKLLAEGVKGNEYKDADWAAAEQGAYRYGVEAVYYNNEKALIVYTDSIGKDMEAVVNVTLNTNTISNEAEGAQVVLLNQTHIYGAVADENGKATLTNNVGSNKIWKGNYTLNIRLAGFEDVVEQIEIKDNEYNLNYTLKEIQVQPSGLLIVKDDEDKPAQRTFVWNWPDQLYDGFEEHENFAINSPGEIGWQYVDGDGDGTLGFSACTWPGMYEPSAWMVFNASATEPSIAGYNLMDAYTGSKCLVSFGTSTGTNNDDWFITPRLFYQNDFKLKFSVRATDGMGNDSYRVGYSMKGMDKEDFIWLTDTLMADTWYSTQLIDIPAGAAYVAIVHCNAGGHCLLVDDVYVGYNLGWYVPPFAGAMMPAEKGAYEYYIDDEKKSAFTDDYKVTIDGIAPGEHTFAVRACYTSGNTPWTTGSFAVEDNGSGIANVVNTETDAKYYDLTGKRVDKVSQRGVYIKAGKNGAQKIVK